MVLELVKENLKKDQRVFLGVIDVINPRIETPAEVRDMVLEAASVISPEQLGTCDDCGFSPFSDDTSTEREVAFAKIRARLEGTKLAEKILFR
jgi:5-methyltetrahydropteroyltriglutamate--homocysteine methyltransferase